MVFLLQERVRLLNNWLKNFNMFMWILGRCTVPLHYTHYNINLIQDKSLNTAALINDLSSINSDVSIQRIIKGI